MKESKFRTDIEGIRAIAILLVVIYHMKIGILSGGFIGVDVFFVLSGYLITSILIREYEINNNINLLEFFARRIRRLLPAISFLILFIIAFSYLVFAPMEQRYLTTSALSTALYSSNIYFTYQSSDYLGGEEENNPFLHTWSLSVEEQYYLFFPIFLIAIFYFLRNIKTTRKSGYIILVFIVVFIVSFISSVILTEYRQPWVFFLMPFRAWEFVAGSLAFLLPHYFKESLNQQIWSKSLKNEILMTSLGWMGFVILILTAVFFTQTTKFPGYAAILPVIGTIALVSFNESSNKWSVNYFLSNKVFQVLGRLSYSWYLWHWVILVFANALYGSHLSITTKCLLMLIALSIAELSFRFLENPIRHNKTLSLRPIYPIILAIFLTAIGVSSSILWRFISINEMNSPEQIKYAKAKQDLSEIIVNSECDVDFYTDIPKACSFGNENALINVVLIGDSHARHWFPTLQEVALRNNWRLHTFIKSGCPIINVPFFYEKIGRVYTECDNWRGLAIEEIKTIKPKMVFIGSSSYELSEQNWEKGLRLSLDELNEVSEQVIIFRNTPSADFDIPICLARHNRGLNKLSNQKSCEFERETTQKNMIFGIYQKVQKSYSNVNVLDMTKYICPSEKCSGENADFVIYRDKNHLTASFAKSLAPDLEREIDTIIDKKAD